MVWLLLAGICGVTTWLLVGRNAFFGDEESTAQEWLEASTEELIEITREFLMPNEEWMDAAGEFRILEGTDAGT